jgi:hypothetical protein
MDPDTLLLALLGIHQSDASDDEKDAAALWLAQRAQDDPGTDSEEQGHATLEGQ